MVDKNFSIINLDKAIPLALIIPDDFANSDFTFCHVKPLIQGLTICFQIIKTTKQLLENTIQDCFVFSDGIGNCMTPFIKRSCGSGLFWKDEAAGAVD